MVAHYGISEQTASVGRWSQTLGELHGRIAHRFAHHDLACCDARTFGYDHELPKRLTVATISSREVNLSRTSSAPALIAFSVM